MTLLFIISISTLLFKKYIWTGHIGSSKYILIIDDLKLNKMEYHFEDLLTIHKFIRLKQEFVLEEVRDILSEKHTRDDINNNLMLVRNREEAIAQYNVTLHDIEKTERNFNKFYIIPALSIMHENFLKKFFKEIRDKGILTQEGLDNFKQLVIHDLNNLLDDIDSSEYLGADLKTEATTSVMDTIAVIQKYKYSELRKIPMKMSRNEIVTLFHLLLKNGFIPPRITKNQLSRFIEDSFQYYDDIEYKEITRVVKLEHELLGDKRVRSPQNTLENLKSLFNDSFFSLKENCRE